MDIGESFIRLSTAGSHLTAADWFTPFNKDSNSTRKDLDTGSAGTILYDVGGAHLDDQRGQGRPHLHPQPRQPRATYTPGADTGAVQTVPKGPAGVTGGLFGCPAFFQSAVNGPTLYFAAVGDKARAFVLDPATGKLTGAATSATSEVFGYPGSVPSISSDAGTNGIAWMLEGSSTLHAYNADNLGTELYNSNQAPNGRDALSKYVKFTTPIIVQGKVYAGTESQLVAYGLLAPVAAADVTGQVKIKLRAGTATTEGVKVKATVINRGTTAIAGPLSLVVDGLGKKFTLANATGTTSATTPRASFYRNVALPGGTLAPGESVSAELKFASTKHAAPAMTARVLAGAGAR